MAQIKHLSGRQLLIKVGDGASPEQFNADCLINTDRGAAFSADTEDFVLPDCDDPALPGWKENEVDGLSCTLSGAGTLHTPSVADWFAWFEGGEAKNIQFLVNTSGANGGGHWQGAFRLTSFEVSGSRRGPAEASITLVSSGRVSWTDAA